MNLSVPTNWQPGLLEKINQSKIIEIYGKLDRDPIGGGRPSFILPFIDKRGAKEYIRAVHKYGLKFNYLLNSTCLGNAEWSGSRQKEMRKFLDWLVTIDVDTVTVAIPYLLQVVKKCYPSLETKVSVCAQVSNPFQAKYWEDLGADEITLSPWAVNRDFAALNKIRRAVKCRLQLYANTRCLR
ncbi:MAG: U32 family peptidase, partial [Desulfocucumaceae bacterium]